MCSSDLTDSTLAILHAEQASAPYSMQVKQNPSRLGFAQNFALALSQAQGEIIFFSDQDDVWEKEKISSMLNLFRADPSLQIACSEASLMRSDGSPLPGLVLAGNGLGAEEREEWRIGNSFPWLLRKNPVPGMVLAIRRELRGKILPLPEGWEHDYWILEIGRAHV